MAKMRWTRMRGSTGLALPGVTNARSRLCPSVNPPPLLRLKYPDVVGQIRSQLAFSTLPTPRNWEEHLDGSRIPVCCPHVLMECSTTDCSWWTVCALYRCHGQTPPHTPPSPQLTGNLPSLSLYATSYLYYVLCRFVITFTNLRCQLWPLALSHSI
jgi:hypothetical protein